MKIKITYFFGGVLLSSVLWLLLVFFYLDPGKDWTNKPPPVMGYSNLQSRLKIIPKHRFHFNTDHKELRKKDVKLNHLPFKEKLYSNKKELPKRDSQDASIQSMSLEWKGTPLNQMGLITNGEDQLIRDSGYRLYAFNQLISDRIGYHREVPDTRSPLCKNNVYHTQSLPRASIVICFYNEAWSALLRTVYSVLDRTPKYLLEEIILVDDNSDLSYLKEELPQFIKLNFQNVKLSRIAERAGLMRARMHGAELARGEVIVFLDSHCEVNTEWIGPLLSRISENSHNVVVPIIDIVHSDSFEYTGSPLVRGGFTWGLHFRWDQLPQIMLMNKDTASVPMRTPTMAGGLFAIHRDYFNSLGKYDPGMDIWGGENLEISFRIWMCGGNLEIIPCSRVGHIFRNRRPYGSPRGEDTMMKNSLRVAHVWMDDYKEIYFKLVPNARTTSYGDISDRVALRQKLGCKSFKWYLENIYPDQSLPDANGNIPALPKNAVLPKRKEKIYRKVGHLLHRASQLCVVADEVVTSKKSLVKLAKCDQNNDKQIWYETESNEFLLANVLCFEMQPMSAGKANPRLMKCHGNRGSQEWTWTGLENSQLYNPSSGLCLSVENAVVNSYVEMAMCQNSPLNTFDMRTHL